jgi:hypothetical protein
VKASSTAAIAPLPSVKAVVDAAVDDWADSSSDS